MLCIVIDQYSLLSFLCQPNIPKFRGEYFAIQTLFAQVTLGDYNNIIVHEKHALHITQVCIPSNSGDIISNLLLSRAYFLHLFHMISAKVKKSFKKTFKKWPLLVGRTSPFAEVRPRSEVNTCGSDLTLGSHTGACGIVA